jgi:hypothetical protein
MQLLLLKLLVDQVGLRFATERFSQKSSLREPSVSPTQPQRERDFQKEPIQSLSRQLDTFERENLLRSSRQVALPRSKHLTQVERFAKVELLLPESFATSAGEKM